MQNSQFFEPQKETKKGVKNWVICGENQGKNTVFEGRDRLGLS